MVSRLNMYQQYPCKDSTFSSVLSVLRRPRRSLTFPLKYFNTGLGLAGAMTLPKTDSGQLLQDHHVLRKALSDG